LGTDDFEGIVMQHDDILLPHWNEFATALQLYQNEINEFSIRNVKLTDPIIRLLTESLKHKPIYEFFLNNNEFDDTEQLVKFALEIIQSNRQIKDFWCSGNQLESMDNANRWVEAIISHPSINKVRLENCLRGDINVYQILCSLIASNKAFSTIDLDNNGLQTGDSTDLPDYIANNPPLKILYLQKNKLNDNDAILIAKALKDNTNLLEIYIKENEITQKRFYRTSQSDL